MHEEDAAATMTSNETSGSSMREEDPARSANYRLAQDTRGLFLGAMPPDIFLEQFLPLAKPPPQEAPDLLNCSGVFTRVATAKKEAQMYTRFIIAVTPFAPNFKLIDTHAHPDPLRGGLAPDISMYSVNHQLEEGAQTDFSKMELFVEFEFADSSDPFLDPEEDPLQSKSDDFRFENDSEDAILARGKLASYAAAHAGSQYRVHTFCVLVCGEYARLIRWDPDGAIVTQRFNYIQQPHILAGFFRRYDHDNLDPSWKGYDTSVSSIDHGDLVNIPQIYLEILEKRNIAHHEFRILRVPDRNNPEDEKQFVVSFPPNYTARSPFGRGTRPMLALDMEKGEIVFLKDYWRTDLDGIEKEGDIYALLESNRVPNIPPFGKGNDVRDHKTLTHTLRDENWACWSKDMMPLRHYRMSLDVVALPLTSFRSSREFVSAIADAMEAHDHAYFDAHVLHRDISVGNILITDEGKGLLIDWDLCAKVDPNNDNQLTCANDKHLDRTGTWEFMSAKLLRNIKKRNELEDDRESCLHVLTWMALRYTSHSISNGCLEHFLMDFDETYEAKGGVHGGMLKSGSLLSRKIPEQVKFDHRPHLDNLIAELTETFAVRCERKPSEKEFEIFEELEKKGKSGKNPSEEDSEELKLPHKEILAYYRVSEYRERTRSLKKRGWLVETFKRHLDAGPWPTSDRAEKQLTDDEHRAKRRRIE